MNRLTVSMCLLATLVAPVAGAQQSLPDSNPECMQVNGPDCVLQSATQPNRYMAPQKPIGPTTPVTPPLTPVVVSPPLTTRGPAATAASAPAATGATGAEAGPAVLAPKK